MLLDTHTLIWTVDDPSRLGAIATATLQDSSNELLVSAATLWEIAIKLQLGKLTLSDSYRSWISQAILDLNASVLPIRIEDCEIQVGLSGHHRDPFDRMLVAQAIVDNAPIVSRDEALDAYAVRRLW